MLPGLEMMACPNLAVPPEVMHHVVKVESSHNPFAIGVVGGQLVRQPQNLGEALATVKMLEQRGYNFSVGLAQVNRSNLGKYGLDSYEKAFDICNNLAAGSRILSQCYASSGSDWGKAFSCYYSGNFVTGYRDGYVQKIYDSINRGPRLASNQAIPLATREGKASAHSDRANAYQPIDEGSYRVALRSVAIDSVANALVGPAVARAAGLPAPAPGSASVMPQMPSVQGATQPPLTDMQAAMAGANMAIPSPGSSPNTAPNAIAAGGGGGSDDIFVPQVRGPNDPSGGVPPSAAPTTASGPVVPQGDQADVRQGNRDAAFVF
jgi:type IV secretion system protein VirB1